MKKTLLTALFMFVAIMTMQAQEKNVVNLTMKESLKATYYPEKRYAAIIGIKDQGKTEHFADSLNVLGFDLLKSYSSSGTEISTILENTDVFGSKYDVLLFYFNGDVMQRNGKSYLLPAGIEAGSAEALAEAVPCDSINTQFKNSKATKRIVIIEGDVISTDGEPVKQFFTGDDNTVVAYSIKDDVLGQYSDNLYAKGVAKEKAEAQEALDAIKALEALEAASKQPETPEEYYDYAMKLKNEYKVDDAMEYFKAAANKGHVESMYQLALLYQGKNETQAMIWMGRASAAGHEMAKAYVAARKQPMQQVKRTTTTNRPAARPAARRK